MDNKDVSATKRQLLVVFKNLILYFLERQQVVVLAMLDVSPVLLQMSDANIPPFDLEPYIESFNERMANIQDTEEIHNGTWNNQWKYHIHGIGCKLTNLHTHEPLEWDAPDSNAFQFDWFWKHLLWRVQNQADDPYIQSYQKSLRHVSATQVKQVLEENGTLVTRVDGLCYLQSTKESID